MAYIGNSPANVGNYQVVDDISSTFNGVLTSFALTALTLPINPAKSGQLLVSINGVLQEPDDTGAEGFLVSGSNIVFSSAPATGSTFWAVWQGQAVDIGTPSDSTVGTDQLSATGTKSGTTYLAGDNTWKTVVTDLVNDTTPQLGGNLDFQTHKATTFTSTGIDDNATSTKLTVADTGIDVTGSVTCDGLTVDGNGGSITIDTGATAANPRLYFDHNNLTSGLYFIEADRGTQAMEFATSSKVRMGIASNGDISFYEDTGTTPKFFWDASAESLGIGTSTTTAKLNVAGDSVDGTQVRFTGATNENYQLRLGFDTSNLVSKIQSIHVGTAYKDLALQPDGGNVGIGTSSPEFKLHVEESDPYGGIKISGVNAPGLTIEDDTDNAYSRIVAQNGGELRISADVPNLGSGSFVSFRTAGDIERMRIDSSGNVGIGTSSPATALDVRLGGSIEGTVSGGVANFVNSASAGDSAVISITAGTTGYSSINFADSADKNIGQISYNHSNNSLGFRTNDVSDRMTINSSGNVGIGTSSPWDKLSVEMGQKMRVGTSLDSSGNPTIDLYRWQGSGTQYRSARISCSVDGSIGILNATAGGADFSAQSFIERMRIDSSGRIQMGTTSSSYSERLRVYNGSGYTITSTRTGTGNEGHMVFQNGNGAVGTIFTNGTSTSYNTSSDYRLKENVVPMSASIDRLKQLKPCNFNFIADVDTTVDGFLAHEAGEVVPECVTGTKDAMMTEEYEVTPAVMDGETVVTEAVMGEREVPDYQGIDQSKLVPLLVSALQEAITRIEQLENN